MPRQPQNALDTQQLEHRLAYAEEVYALCDSEERSDDQCAACRPLQERRGPLAADDASVYNTGEQGVDSQDTFTHTRRTE